MIEFFKSRVRHNLHIVLSLVFYFGLVAYVLNLGYSQNHIFSYPIDDTYIHLGLAKSISNHFVYGVGGNASSCSSSPMYGLILSILFLILPYKEFIPLFICLISGAFAIMYMSRYLKKYRLFPVKALALMYIVFSGSFILQTVMGMEHVFHAVFFMAYIFFAALVFRKIQNGRYFWTLVVFGNVLTMIRFESIFVIFFLFAMLLLYGHFKRAIFFLSSYFTLFAFGLFSIRIGGFFFPNSLMIKGRIPDHTLKGIIRLLLDFLIDKSPVNTSPSYALNILFVLIFGLLIYKIYKHKDARYPSVLILFFWLVSCSAQTLLAGIGWLFRYEFYLVVSGYLLFFREISVFAVRIYRSLNLAMILIFIALFAQILVPVAYFRGKKNGLELAVKGMAAIRNQHHVMGDFIGMYYNHRRIGLNDVGVVSFKTDANIFDITGLCNNEVVKTIRGKGWSYLGDHLFSMMEEKQVDLVCIYDSYYAGFLKKSYFKVAELEVPKESVTGGNVISFYVRDLKEKDYLLKSISQFHKRLPKGCHFNTSF